jgi:NACHT domain
LKHTDPSSLHQRAWEQKDPETCRWIQRLPEWSLWLQKRIRCLWIHGIPGAGKTILMSHLIEQTKDHCKSLKNKKVINVYYYCYFGHEQDEAAPLIQWLIEQLCRKDVFIPTSLYEMYKAGSKPSLGNLLNMLEEILREFELVYVLVDALDESSPRSSLLKILRDLAIEPRFEKLLLLASSREYIDIEQAMEEFSTPVSMANSFVEEDIKQYVHSALQSNSKFHRWPRDILLEVEDRLSKDAKGM